MVIDVLIGYYVYIRSFNCLFKFS